MSLTSAKKSLELWFPFTPGVIGIDEAETGAVHNRPFGSVLAEITAAAEWEVEQCYFTDENHQYTSKAEVTNRFFPVSFRRHYSSRRGARQWSMRALAHVLFSPPQALGIFFAYGRFAKALACAARLRRVPYFVIVGGWYNRISRSQRSYFDRAFRVFVHTEMQKQELVRVGYRADNIEIFPLGIDNALFTPKTADQYGWTNNGPRLLYVGRLQPSKGPMEALMAFAVVKQNFPNARLQIVGPCNDESFRQQMINYADVNGLTASVTFAGPIPYEMLPDLYQQSDLFLFPSPYEGLPSVVLESMACGTPPVVMRGSGGTEEALVDGECGWVMDMPRLAYDVLQLLRNQEEIRRRGENAARRIEDCYSARRTYDILMRNLSEMSTLYGPIKVVSPSLRSVVEKSAVGTKCL
ncbi:MAG TPA: glycosyltransferase family 4 protein [Pyrinomonadaceae bacterium]|nr:glycosyltransferase family 4 protein [Pyrinomonadaceae bacterium]